MTFQSVLVHFGVAKKQKPGAFLVANTQTKKLSRIPTSSWIRHGFPNRASVKAASIWNVENAVSLSTPYQLIRPCQVWQNTFNLVNLFHQTGVRSITFQHKLEVWNISSMRTSVIVRFFQSTILHNLHIEKADWPTWVNLLQFHTISKPNSRPFWPHSLILNPHQSALFA